MPKIASSFLILFALSLPVLGQGLANVAYKSGDRDRFEEGVTITDETYSRITARKGAARISFEPSQLVKLEYLRGPKEWAAGKSAFEDGDYDRAASRLAEALESRASDKWLPIYVHWYHGRALAQLGRFEEAAESLGQIAKLSKDHRFVPEAYAFLAQMHTSRGKAGVAEAQKALDALKALRIGGRWDQEVELGLARLELLQGNADAALGRLTKLETAADTFPEIAQLVRLEKGNALVKKGQFAQAEGAFKAILGSKAEISAEVRAGACNGLGNAQMALQKWEDAFKSYSRTFVWFQDMDTLRQEVGWALWKGGEALSTWADSLQGEERAKQKTRAKRLWTRAFRSFGETRGGAGAKEALGL